MSIEFFEEWISVTVEDDDCLKYKRLDQYLSDLIEQMSRSVIKNIFQKGLIYNDPTQENPKKLELKKMPPAGTTIIVEIPPPLPSKATPENIPLDIIFEDEHLIIVNKPAGLVTHPAPGNYTGTLVNAILYHCKDLSGVGDEKRPGIVHRLDKGTSGIMVVAKNHQCHQGLIDLFSKHEIDRVYHAIVMGSKHPATGTIEGSIGRHPLHRKKMAMNVKNGKDAITHFKVLEYFEKFSLVELKLETGRTHQIRVHLSTKLRAPILCDPLYGSPNDHIKRLGNPYNKLIKDYSYPFLHARVLGFIHPITKKKLYFEVNPPDTFSQILKIARKEKEIQSK
jgi:23S rRNA pseudouridine1911/1915/1917 synthase